MEMKHAVLRHDRLFEFEGMLQPVSVSDFWAWAMSRLLADGPRGDLAEFIVNIALGMDIKVPKRGWGECDIVYNGYRIEVKCSSYLQAWEREHPSKPVFSITKTRNCDIEDYGDGYRYIGNDDSPPERRSELYVFCLFANQDRQTADPMKLEQWEFRVASTKVINEVMGDQKKISLPSMKKIGATKCDFYNIQKTIEDSISKYNISPNLL